MNKRLCKKYSIVSKVLYHCKITKCIFDCFYLFWCRMLPRLFQFLYCVRSIIHRQSQISLYLCDICGMYLEAVFRFYVLLNHFVGHFFFGLVRFGSFSNTIYRNLALALSKLHINVDITVGFFVGQKNYRLIMNAPVKDISADEKETLTDYLKNGGRMLLLAGCTQDTLSNLTDFISQYGMDLKNGFVADPAPQHYYNNNPFNVIPDYDFASSLLSGIDSSAAALLVQPAGMTIQENPSEDIAVQPFLTTSDSAFLVDPATQEKTQGTYVLGAVATETVNEEEGTSSMLTVITAPSMIDDSILSRFPSITNLTLFMNAAASGLPGVTPLSIPSKSLDITYNMVTSAGLWSALFIIVIPVIFLIAGFVIWLKRRKL